MPRRWLPIVGITYAVGPRGYPRCACHVTPLHAGPAMYTVHALLGLLAAAGRVNSDLFMVSGIATGFPPM